MTTWMNLAKEIKLLGKLNDIKLLDTSSFEQVGFPYISIRFQLCPCSNSKDRVAPVTV